MTAIARAPSALEAALDAAVPKVYRSGTHRSTAPQETIARAMRLAPVMGITRVATITGLDTIGVPVVMVCRPNARSLSVSQGKGLDLDAARASGLMESVESYHAEGVTLPLKLASYEELRYTHRVADVGLLAQTEQSRFTPQRQILWVEGFDLIQREPVWLPFDCVHCNYTLSLDPGGLSSGFVCSSNGLASGNHLAEALCHALAELIERDAATRWQERDDAWQRGTRVDLAGVGDPACCALLEQYARADIAVGVWDATSDLGVPVFSCRIIDRVEHPLRPIAAAGGIGCHPSPAIALARALTEAAQSRLTLIAGSREDWSREDYRRVLAPEALERVRAGILGEPPQRPFAAGGGWGAEIFSEDLSEMLARVRGAGCARAIAVDLTRPEFGIPVVKLVVPGLEPPHHHAGGRITQRARASHAAVGA